jgi:hypothetical protein
METDKNGHIVEDSFQSSYHYPGADGFWDKLDYVATKAKKANEAKVGDDFKIGLAGFAQ